MKKMISRRNFLKAAALAGSAMALTACGGKGSAGDEAAAHHYGDSENNGDGYDPRPGRGGG